MHNTYVKTCIIHTYCVNVKITVHVHTIFYLICKVCIMYVHNYVATCLFSSITRSAVQQNFTSETADNLLSIVEVRMSLRVRTYVCAQIYCNC